MTEKNKRLGEQDFQIASFQKSINEYQKKLTDFNGWEVMQKASIDDSNNKLAERDEKIKNLQRAIRENEGRLNEKDIEIKNLKGRFAQVEEINKNMDKKLKGFEDDLTDRDRQSRDKFIKEIEEAKKSEKEAESNAKKLMDLIYNIARDHPEYNDMIAQCLLHNDKQEATVRK